MLETSENITTIARTFGLTPREVRFLIGHYRIPTRRIGPNIVVESRHMADMVDAIRRHIGEDVAGGRVL